MDIQQIKQRFKIIGSNKELDRAIDTAIQVAPTDISVLITGESGVGKEVFPQIIHSLSPRKHGQYIAMNCGAIPEGTIDSELFGHEKGSFTGAHESRKGYFEVADGGTIFLDEVAELPTQTQVRLLRVLETGEFIKVGSSHVQKTDIRIVAASNVDIPLYIQKGKFREDLYYRLNTVPINIPPLRRRKEDIHLFFRKFAADFAEKYRMPIVKLDEEAQKALIAYHWPGNVRQIKNLAEQISVIEEDRLLNKETLISYLPENIISNLPVLFNPSSNEENLSEREILYKVLFDMKSDIADLKKLVFGLIQNRDSSEDLQPDQDNLINRLLERIESTTGSKIKERTIEIDNISSHQPEGETSPTPHSVDAVEVTEVEEESLSLRDKEMELIKKALKKHKSNKNAALELGISERTLYRKIKEYDINQ